MSHPEAAPKPPVEPSFEAQMAAFDARLAQAEAGAGTLEQNVTSPRQGAQPGMATSAESTPEPKEQSLGEDLAQLHESRIAGEQEADNWKAAATAAQSQAYVDRKRADERAADINHQAERQQAYNDAYFDAREASNEKLDDADVNNPYLAELHEQQAESEGREAAARKDRERDFNSARDAGDWEETQRVLDPILDHAQSTGDFGEFESLYDRLSGGERAAYSTRREAMEKASAKRAEDIKTAQAAAARMNAGKPAETAADDGAQTGTEGAAAEEISTGRHAADGESSGQGDGKEYKGKHRRGGHSADGTAAGTTTTTAGGRHSRHDDDVAGTAAAAAGATAGAATAEAATSATPGPDAAQATNPVDDVPRSVDEWRRKFGVVPTPAGESPLDDLFNNNAANTAGTATMTDQEFQDFLNGAPAAPASPGQRVRNGARGAYVGLGAANGNPFVAAANSVANWARDTDRNGERSFRRRTALGILAVAGVLGAAWAIREGVDSGHHAGTHGAGVGPDDWRGVTHPTPNAGGHNPNLIDGFNPEVTVRKGEGLDHLIGQVAGQKGVHLTGAQEHEIYRALIEKHGPNVFTDNKLYDMGNGNFGISRPGVSHVHPSVLHDLNLLVNASIEAAQANA